MHRSFSNLPSLAGARRAHPLHDFAQVFGAATPASDPLPPFPPRENDEDAGARATMNVIKAIDDQHAARQRAAHERLREFFPTWWQMQQRLR
jgi:hypothetical protein